MAVPQNNPRKLQAATELLTTYSFALLIIALVLVALYLVFFSPQTVTPSICTFSNGVKCVDISLGSNTQTSNTQITVFLTNTQPYAISNPIMFSTINGANSSFVSCVPSYIKTGGSIICALNISQRTTVGQFLSGTLYVRGSYCGLAANTSNCTNAPLQTYVGQYSSHTQNATSLGFTLVLKPASNVINTNNQKDLINAYLKLGGYPVPGATIKFTENNTNYFLSPTYADTDSNGTAQTYIWGNKTGTVKVTATFGGTTSITVLYFTPGYIITFDLTKFMYCPYDNANILTFQGSGYNCGQLTNTVTLPIGPGLYTYSFVNASTMNIPSATYPFTRDTFNNFTLNGVPFYAENGTLSINTNSIVNIVYNTQYYIVSLAEPPSGAANVLVSQYCSPLPSSCVYFPQGAGVWATNISVYHQYTIYESPLSTYTFTGWACILSGCAAIGYNGLGSTTSFSYNGLNYNGNTTSKTFYSFNGPIIETANFQTSTTTTAGTTTTSSTTTSTTSTSTTSTITTSTTTSSTTTTTILYYEYCLTGANSSSISNYQAFNSIALSTSGLSGSWNALSSYPINVGAQSCATSNGYIYCVGGVSPNNKPSNAVYYAPISGGGSNSWSSTNAYPYPMNVVGMACSASGSDIYCVGGYNSVLVTNAVYYAPISGTGIGPWTATTPYPYGKNVSDASCVTYSNYIYCIGGDKSKSSTYAVSTSYVANAPISGSGVGSWTTSYAYPSAVQSAGCTVYNNYIYCVGGNNWAGIDGLSTLSTVYYAPMSSSGGITLNWQKASNKFPLATPLQSCTTLLYGDIYCIASQTASYYAAFAGGSGNQGVNQWSATAQYPVATAGPECVEST